MSRDPYDRVNWQPGLAGGTAMGPTNFNKMDKQIKGIDLDLDVLEDNVTAIQAALAGTGTLATYNYGTTFPVPTLGSPPFFYLVDHKLYMPGGTAWYAADGTVVSGTVSGGSNAPTNFTAVVNPDNTVSTAWTLPTPPATYSISAVTVREKFKSPGGVSGMPLAGTATSSLRPTSSTASTREYYVTCTFSKAANPDIESAESNHVTVVLPYGSTAGGTGGGTPPSGGGTVTPASILGIGTTCWFNLDIGLAGGANISHQMSEIAAGYVQDPYFTANDTNDAVHMQCFANSGTTSGSSHPRTEFREVYSDGTKAAWNMGSGSHIMSGTSKVTHLPADSESNGTPKPWTCFAQIHDAKGDVIRLQVEDTAGTPAQVGGTHSVSSLRIVAHTHTPDGGASTEGKVELQSTYSIGDDINWKIEDINGTCRLYLGGVVKHTVTGLSGSGGYFKCGDYQQFSTASGDGQYNSSSYAVVELRNVVVTHS